MATAGPREREQRVVFGLRVRRLRSAQGFSQEDFAHKVGLDRTYIGGVECGERNISLDNIHRIASALEISPSALFTEQ